MVSRITRSLRIATGKIRFLNDPSSTTTIVLIDHNPEVVSKLARRFVLLRKTGSVLKTGSTKGSSSRRPPPSGRI